MTKRIPWSVKDGKKLRAMRKSVGLSQAQLGLAAGVTGSRICEIETVDFPGGRHCSPAAALAAKIEDALRKASDRKAKAAEKAAAKAAAA